METIPLFTGFYTSLVVEDFFHQQYELMGCILSLEGLESKLFDISNETPLSK